MMGQYTAASGYAKAPAAHADVKMPAMIVTSNILPPSSTPMPPIGQALPTVQRAPPQAAPRPYVPAAAPVATYAYPSLQSAVLPPHKPPLSLKNGLAAAALGIGGWFLGGPLGAAAGALVGAVGSKAGLKW